MKNTELVIYQANNSNIKLEVRMEDETVWLTQQQISELFDTTRTNVVEHIKHVYDEGELDAHSTCRNFRQVRKEGNREVVRDIPHYDLDVIISVGYRVKSKHGVEFRKWANKVLKDYILKGYAANNARISELGQILQIMQRTTNLLDSNQILNVIQNYTTAITMLDDYDHQRLQKPQGNKSTYTLTYEECKEVISNMKPLAESNLFGNEKDNSFQSSIASIYQTFGGEDVYPSLEEKAANLLYLITKNHSFSDGNKRIAATLFLYFLDRNGVLFVNGSKSIDDYTLVAITIMVAESKPTEKDMVIRFIMNFLSK